MKVFISCARENRNKAEELYNALKDAGVSPWMDEKDLHPGEVWNEVIPRVIEECSYFIVLLSSESANKIGYVHKELKIAFDILDKSPGSRIFIIPVRLDDCIPADIDHRLKYIHYVDLFPSINKGLRWIRRVLECDTTEKKTTQISGEITLIYEKDRLSKYKYKVQKLKQEIRGKKLIMTWDTFINGLQNLKDIIITIPTIAPDIIFGINETGIMAASYLSFHMISKPSISIIKTGGILPPDYKTHIIQFYFPNHKVKQCDGTYQVFPNVKKPKSIAIVDIEIKSGYSVKSIIDMLRAKYGEIY